MKTLFVWSILCAVLCLWPALAFVLGWLMARGRFHISGLSERLAAARQRRVISRATLGAGRPGAATHGQHE